MNITTNKIAVSIKDKTIFENINIALEGNKLIAITGKSGCGKTTLLNCLGLIQEIGKGSIFIDGKNTGIWKDKDKTKFWHESASFIYQDYGIIDNESVFYNITLSKDRRTYKESEKILSLVGLEGRGKDQASVLSGGEKQRLGIARAIYKKAKVIFADEPTASLDTKNREMVVELLKSRRDSGTLIILATHDDRLIAECDEIVDMELIKNRI
ncbi:putative ABC transport system ATP-binding protein [Peptostreptococcaceae bacterium pGA-8]|nr:putative ABC transport system ATP-binding protein [Peptostreptococcaceae bacterium pGA-8]